MTPPPFEKILNDASKNQEWEEGSQSIKAQISALSNVLEVDRLIELAGGAHAGGAIAVSFVSQEYLALAPEWAKAMQRCHLSNYVIVCGDAISYESLAAQGIPAISARIDASGTPATFRNRDGFAPKGLAMNALKFPVASALTAHGFDVVISDIDAFWLQDPYPFFPADVDLAFQRVVMFPAAAVRLWGFALCSGFVFFRNSPATRSFLQACVRWNDRVQNDQLAANLALIAAEMKWDFPEGYAAEYPLPQKAAEEQFCDFWAFSFRGVSSIDGLKAMALSHEQFWRHPFYPPSKVVVCHPNSPKDQEDKLLCLNYWLGRAGG